MAKSKQKVVDGPKIFLHKSCDMFNEFNPDIHVYDEDKILRGFVSTDYLILFLEQQGYSVVKHNSPAY